MRPWQEFGSRAPFDYWAKSSANAKWRIHFSCISCVQQMRGFTTCNVHYRHHIALYCCARRKHTIKCFVILCQWDDSRNIANTFIFHNSVACIRLSSSNYFISTIENRNSAQQLTAQSSHAFQYNHSKILFVIVLCHTIEVNETVLFFLKLIILSLAQRIKKRISFDFWELESISSHVSENPVCKFHGTHGRRKNFSVSNDGN